MAFHQNGSALTGFAKNYTNLHVSKYTYLLFSIPTLLAIFASILGFFAIINKTAQTKFKAIGAAFLIGGIGYIAYTLNTLPDTLRIDPELFQSFNPMFVVWLTPVMVGFFAYLSKRGKEPSAPTKIGIGMMITAFAYVIMLISSLGLPSVGALGGNTVDAGLAISPYWLINTYLTLTIAELFLSPMGLSFVAKVAPPKLRGLMQGGWLAATAIGNYAAGFVGRFYQNWELWEFFVLLAGLAALSGFIMFSILKIVNRASQS
jgi:POT family proton-dependent oligopeptide transporter